MESFLFGLFVLLVFVPLLVIVFGGHVHTPIDQRRIARRLLPVPSPVGAREVPVTATAEVGRP